MASGRKEVTFFWFIENHSSCLLKYRFNPVSPPFLADTLEGTEWHLELSPIESRIETKEFIPLYLRRRSFGPKRIPMKFELSILAEDGSVLSSKESECSFRTWSKKGWDSFLKIDKTLFRQKFPQDILTVRCKMWQGEGEVDRVVPIHARTCFGVEKVSFLLVVDHFSMLQPNQKNTLEIQSPLTAEKKNLACTLYYTSDSCPEGEMRVLITVPPHPRWIPILMKIKISLLDASGNKILCANDEILLDVVTKDFAETPLTLTRQDIQDKESEYLPGNKLTLQCKCSFYTGLEFNKILATPYEMPKSVAKLSKILASAYTSGMQEDMKALYMKKCLTDVELKTQTKSFPAHKSVLCARSPVFERMLTSNMKEKNTGSIQVDDLRDNVIEQFLLFFYSDTIENLNWEMATRLFYAADKYEVGRLKAVCSSFLVANLTPTNAGELLLLADTHSDMIFKKMVEDFILEHDREVFGSEEWEKLMEYHPVLALKIMHQKYKRQKTAL